MANGILDRVVIEREIAVGVKPETFCELCEKEVTLKDLCCIDACYIVIDGVVYIPDWDSGDEPNAWEGGRCDNCCSCRSNRVGYEAGWAMYDNCDYCGD